MSASVVLAGRTAGLPEKRCRAAVEVFVTNYQNRMKALCEMPALEAGRYEVHRMTHVNTLSTALRKSERATPKISKEKLTTVNAKSELRFRKLEPVLFSLPSATGKSVYESLKAYRRTLLSERQHLLDFYRPVDVAFKVVGTGSVGMRDYVVLLLGNDNNDALFLQIKEAGESALASYLPRAPRTQHNGRRVIEGQRRMQSQSDLLLGWTSIEGRHYLVRHLCDHKASVEIADLRGNGLAEYAAICGEILAKAHGRSGDPCVLSAYMGNSIKLHRALDRFAVAYADQAEKDFSKFCAAIKRGRIKADLSAAK